MDVRAEESPWASTVVLGDGETAFIRPMGSADGEALSRFHQRQSAESIYRRYFSPKPELSDSQVQHFTNVDMVDRVALAVELHDEFVGWASYERWPGRNDAEVAFMVDDEHHGRGIATLLLEHLAAIARANGVERFTAEVLADNRAMLSVFTRAGWPLERRFDSGVVDLDWEIVTTAEFLDSVERREQRADSRAVARILLPRAVAVIGASDRTGSVGAELWQNVVGSVSVPAYPVNPAHRELDGRRCYRSVDELPDEVSLAIVAVPVPELDGTIDACIAKRMRGAVIVTSVDIADADLDVEALVTRARRNGLRIIGPSSMGVATPRPETLLQAALVRVDLPPGRLAVSMQSGSLGASLLRRAHELQLGLSWFVSLGDKSDISANDLLQFWEDDDNTSVIAIYTESFGNPRKFARLARRLSLRRPIVAVRTAVARDGAIAGPLYKQAGLIEVPTVHSLLDTCRVLVGQPVLRGPRVAVITNSRSPGTLASTALTAAGLEPVRANEHLGWRMTADDYAAAMAQALGDPDIDGLLVIYAPPVVRDLGAPSAAIDEAARASTKPVVAVTIGAHDGPIVPGSDVPAFSFPEQAANALGRSWAYGRWLAEEADTSSTAVRMVDPDDAQRVIDVALGTASEHLLGIVDIQRLLRSYGIAHAPAEPATPATALDVARRLGFPLAIKAVRRRPGRSARVGVALDVLSETDVTEVLGVMQESLGADADDLVVQQMVTPGVDVRVHCRHDERLGVIVSVGLGGEQADVIDDRVDRLAPLSPASARSMIDETRAGAALAEAGFDPSPLVDTIVLAAQLMTSHRQIAELDLNPVIVSDGEAVATDARVVLQRHDQADGPLRRL